MLRLHVSYNEKREYIGGYYRVFKWDNISTMAHAGVTKQSLTLEPLHPPPN